MALLRRDSGVALDQASEHATQGFDTQGERCHVEQQYILDIACQDTGLDSGTNSYHLVRVHAAMRLAIKDAPDQGLHCGHARLAADQDNLLNSAWTNIGIGERLHDGAARLLDQVLD